MDRKNDLIMINWINVEKVELLYLKVERKNGWIWQLFKMVNKELQRAPAIEHLSKYLREMKICPHKNLCVNVHSFIICNNQKCPPVDE